MDIVVIIAAPALASAKPAQLPKPLRFPANLVAIVRYGHQYHNNLLAETPGTARLPAEALQQRFPKSAAQI